PRTAPLDCVLDAVSAGCARPGRAGAQVRAYRHFSLRRVQTRRDRAAFVRTRHDRRCAVADSRDFGQMSLTRRLRVTRSSPGPASLGVVRVAIIAESFLPNMNGVTHSLLRVLDHLADRGDEVLVIAPGTRRDAPKEVAGARTASVPPIALPNSRRLRAGPGGVSRIRRLLQRLAPHVVHLASPFVLGWRGVLPAQPLGLPTVAIYQTEVPAYAAR